MAFKKGETVFGYQNWSGGEGLWRFWQPKVVSQTDHSDHFGMTVATVSSPRMTTGFRPFELTTPSLLQKGRDHSLPKACFE